MSTFLQDKFHLLGLIWLTGSKIFGCHHLRCRKCFRHLLLTAIIQPERKILNLPFCLQSAYMRNHLEQ
ncbi:MAG: hypothetical protein KH301_00270 [Brachyspira sp.]|nr:hypothetical protein [Brachyspira sp.]